MSQFLPDSNILQSLIGDAVIEIPTHIVKRLERALAKADMRPGEAAFLTHLAQVHHPLWANDAPLQGATLSPEQNESLAQVSRHLNGLNTVLQVLWAALAHNRTPGAQARVGDHLLQGLAQASRELAEGATDALYAGVR